MGNYTLEPLKGALYRVGWGISLVGYLGLFRDSALWPLLG